MKSLFALCVLVFSVHTMAAYHVECGTKVVETEDGDTEVINSYFEVSSEVERFEGLNGKNFDVAIKGQWLKANTVKGSVKNGDLYISAVKGTGFSAMGVVYEIPGMYDDFPVMRVRQVGGIAGGVVTGKYECRTLQI